MNTSGPNTSVGAGAGNDQAPQSQQESGGSGGEQLTHNINDTPDMARKEATAVPVKRPATPGGAATALNRTAQDTRGNQAGSTGTGLGATETGGNQDEFDMPKE